MSIDFSKLCADFLRSNCRSNRTGKLKTTHAHELVAAFFGYKSHASLLSEKFYLLDSLEEACILVSDIPLINHRIRHLKKGLPDDLFYRKIWLRE